MAVRSLIFVAVFMLMVQEGLFNPPAKRTIVGSKKEAFQSKYGRNRQAVEVGRIDAVGVEKTGHKQRFIHSKGPYYQRGYYYPSGSYAYPSHSGGYDYNYPSYASGYHYPSYSSGYHYPSYSSGYHYPGHYSHGYHGYGKH